MKKLKLNIRKKTIIMIIIFALVLISVSAAVYIRVVFSLNEKSNSDKAESIAATVAAVTDVDRYLRVRDSVLAIYNSAENKVSSDRWGEPEWEEYTALFADIEKSADYIALRDDLRRIQNVNSVDCVFLGYIEPETAICVYVVDASMTNACPPGCLDMPNDYTRGAAKDPESGLPAYTTDYEEYGWLMTAGAPLRDAKGNIVGFAFTDISMEEVRSEQNAGVLRLLLSLVAAMLLCCLVSILIINKVLIKPIKNITSAALDYIYGDDSAEHKSFSRLEVTTGDELAELTESMKRMELDINKKIKELMSMDNKLSISRDAVYRMTELANKDALTGVRNKTSYDNYVKKIERSLIEDPGMKFGIVMADLNNLKRTNDTYGHECGDAAIIKLSNVICAVFVHSPVFRIGGDEFVVILQNHDYQHSDELLKEIRGKIERLSQDEALPEHERISAAFGYATYDPDADNCVSDVFGRADKNMYENKRSLKGE